jgi:hypothetical protein
VMPQEVKVIDGPHPDGTPSSWSGSIHS